MRLLPSMLRSAVCVGSPLLALGCLATSTEPGPVFGGEGAQVAGATPLGEAPRADSGAPCADAAPASSVQLLEDFEDVDQQLFKAFEREGWWYVAVDETQGAVFPSVGEFTPSALPEGEATVENRYALRGEATGFRDWGVVWGTTLRWVGRGKKCPFNASKFEGFMFRAKGKGSLHVKLGNPLTVPPEYDGKCTEKCWDNHGMRIHLTDQWQPYVIRWNRVQQGGWGTQAEFDPARLLNLNFSVEGKDLPVEFWLDDITLISPGDPVPTALNPVSSPAATGEIPPAPSGIATSTAPPAAAHNPTPRAPATPLPTPLTTPSAPPTPAPRKP